jgi:hypothetical protein
MDLNKDVESPCELTGNWGFVGYLENGTTVPIGVYNKYCDGVAHANAWLRSTPRGERWEGQRLYKPLTTTEEMEA